MRQLFRLLLLIPFGLVIAIGCGWIFLFFATVFSPELAQLVVAGMTAFGDMIYGLSISGEDPEPVIAAAGLRGVQLVAALLIAPVLITAIAAELFRWPSGLGQICLTGVLATAFPAALLGLTRMPTGAEARVLGALFLTGAVTGFVYWLIAGRGAARPESTGPTA